MTILADANSRTAAGRWVIMPQRGERFMGPKDRTRARIRQRRRRVFTVLVEAIGITFLIGLVPRLRPMLYGTAILAGLLLVYALALLKIHADEIQLARERRLQPEVSANGNGYREPRANGFTPEEAYALAWGGALTPGGLAIIDEDVHVIVRTSEEIEREAILAEASNAR